MNAKIITSGILLSLGLMLECTQPETKSPCDELTEIDRKMLDMVAQIKEEYKGEKKFLIAFDDAQLYWTQYRNRQSTAIFPLSPRKYDYDVGKCKCEVLRDLTEIRVKELQKWLDGVQENTECKGTYKTKK